MHALRLLLVEHSRDIRTALDNDLTALGHEVEAVEEVEALRIKDVEHSYDATIVEDLTGDAFCGDICGVPTVIRSDRAIKGKRVVSRSSPASELVAACRREIAEAEDDLRQNGICHYDDSDDQPERVRDDHDAKCDELRCCGRGER